ncbi:MAG TPA: choice-of-anchor J domain-containing protein, partial [Bacteroidia bacterium]|nr:choice-of-anchor J domain-containing protein [Bacteroidia bacterium]
SQGGNDTYNITVPSGTNQVRIMVYWTDFEGDPLAAKSLVNDLNMTVTDPNSIVYNPWVLNPAPNAATLNANATRAVDDLNNVEQVTIDLPVAGSYTINIDGFMVPQGPETYYLVYEFRGDEVNVTYPIGYEGFVPGETETIRWDAYGNNGTFNLEYSTDLGNSWNSIAPAVAANARYYNWLVPSAVTSEALIRVTRGAVTGQSDDAFSIIGLPQNITVDWACPDSIRLSWSSVTGAVGYEVSVLGANYMDSVTYTTGTYAILTGLNPLVDQWFSVKAYSAANAKGRRANAIYKAPGVFACPIQLDAAVTQLVAPASTTLLDCNDLTGVEISIELQNSGVNPISSIPVFYRINGGTPVSETFPGTITSFATANYTFSATADFSVIGSYDLQIWADYAGDGNHYNDTISIVINSVPGVLASLPFTENFESFTNCSVATNCEQTVCGLTNGWVNDENLVIDDIDWRVSEGATASVATGPDFDHNPGTATGNYLYTEASACFNRTARVITPCIDLTSTTAPQLEFWYHMYGVAMGSLHVDVLSNDIWTLDVMTPISGDQGNSWHQATVDLSAFNGSIATIRFRGITGPDYTSDMAIDDINIYELSAPPVTNFIASATNLCPGQTITLTDLSVNSPQSWDWVITPSTGFAYTGGTSSSSQNPQIQFTAPGIYDVSLTATNGFGNNTYAISSYIVVGSGAAVPLLETFQSGTFPPLNWNVENPDGAITWVNAQVTGSNGNQTDAAYINNYAYNVPGEEDGLISIRVDLSASIYPIVTFDVANATYSPNFNDALRIDISTDCGVTFAPTGYLKVGPGLATVLNQTNSWAPGQASDWRNDTLDLSAYIGSDVVLKFVNVTDYGNNTYLDNINYSELPLSVNDVDGSGIMAVLYPNPSQGEVTLNMNTVQGGPVEFTFTDVRGARIKTVSEVTGSGFTSRKFDLHDFNAGIYFIEIKTPNGSSRLKYIKL